ncbi:polysaccharide pyruvyl transferase family protein [Adhaeribacter radiodurans]|uniref:Polysaccharide pyruvyl transferase family protein n=1 Tax=Adhaeribacter radiodurans TaxID=2745197 RepID=A0A7L7LEQ4_9BACT|nr:polysaccharide pyruvyl transferase family protein [Adhaeribacter radiodurans]QMU31263.1 polysaccharide pyruvyl transferase family protein [Adhaeribacter radiodurans]
MRVLVAGWFSWEDMGTTAGDLIARDMVCKWLEEAGINYEVAVHSRFPYANAIDWEKADQNRYTDIVFVCGPFGNGYPVTNMLEHFSTARLIGLNLSLLDSLENWNPFTLLYERDSSRAAHPDITFYAPPPKVPVVGIILAHKQKEYGKNGKHDAANEAIERLINSREMAIVPIDTVIIDNAGKLRTEGEIESLLSKMDVVVTTRLHGTVLAIKNGIPVIPIDPIAGGAKISLQVKSIGWPLLFRADSLNEKALLEAFEYCLTPDAKREARDCALGAINEINKIHHKFIADIKTLSEI